VAPFFRTRCINLYSLTGSKEKKTYKHINTVTKTASKCIHATIFIHAIIQRANTNLKRIRCNFTENILGTVENLISNHAERFLHKVLGISKLKYS